MAAHTSSQRPIKRLLIANRGEIATRILNTARELSLATYTLYTANDSTHTVHSTHSIQVSSAGSYLNIDEIVSIVQEYHIDAVHPGYGFLSESPEFAAQIWDKAGAVVIGPGAEILSQTGDKLQARVLAENCSVPVLPALKSPTSSVEDLAAFADEVGYPIVVKAVDGGGGRGIRIVKRKEDLEALSKRALQESPSGMAFAEKAAIDGYRHVEVQIIGDGRGGVRHLWERECSIQRRFQKVVEFAPSSIQDRGLVGEVIEAAVRMAKAVNYLSLGTFEFLVRSSPRSYYFLEVNPRLQVEHTVSESISHGLDLVKIQLLLAQGESLDSLIPSSLSDNPEQPPPLHSIQLRVTTEDVSNNWSLSVGKIISYRLPAGHGVRVETNLLPGCQAVIGSDFDSLLAKIIITTSTWQDTVAKARRALEDTYIEGVKTSLDGLHGIVNSKAFLHQTCDTQWLEANLPSVLESGKRLFSKASMGHVGFLGGQLSAEQANISAASSSSVLFRKGDAWSITLRPEDTVDPEVVLPPAHLLINKINRNEFPTALSASITYSSPRTEPQSYTLALQSTNSSASALASTSKHRRGFPSNPKHIVLPFSGKLMELLVDEGDIISKGHVVAVVRQMKMELEIRAERGGTVVWTYEGEEGDEVGEGILIAELEGGAKL
ncbi:hypothetical protein BP5796_06356 [Coleophoma crateriformis]|uniref:Pyruvate carboxylase n=1 Tax=Coleophoma crateriformis TaxID=565419 RepID=A0A3D8RXD8_9HELO|nr:hypothetical protein BP5796_06356 [Coleophoma crateriformis]